MTRSCWGSTRLPLWPIQTSGPLHPSPPLQNPQLNPIFRLRSCPALPEHLAVSFYPALQGSEETGLFCAWQSLIWLQKWKWSHGSSLGEAGVRRDPAQVKERGGGGPAKRNRFGGYIHTAYALLRYSPTQCSPPPQHLIAHVMSCTEWDYLCGGTWGPRALGGTSCRPSSPGNTFRMMFSMKHKGQKPRHSFSASGLVQRYRPSTLVWEQPPAHRGPLRLFCFHNYSLQRGGLPFETCGGGWGLALTLSTGASWSLRRVFVIGHLLLLLPPSALAPCL